MLWIYLIILQILFFLGLLYFLRSVLTRNISKATGRLQDLSKECVAKEEEANRLLQDAQKESKAIVSTEIKKAEEAREKLIKEAHDMREQILKEANKKGADIAEKAKRNAAFLQNQLEEKIDQRAKELVFTLIAQAVPQEFLKNVHEQTVEDAEKGELSFKSLRLTEGIGEAEIITAFPLSEKITDGIKAKLKKKVGKDVTLKVDVDVSLLAGFIIKIGSVVVDASLKYKIQKGMQEK